MAGNVLEWTSNLFKPYPRNSDDGRERANSNEIRMVRGGSWVNSSRFARAASRPIAPSDVRDNGGFRLVLTVPGSS